MRLWPLVFLVAAVSCAKDDTDGDWGDTDIYLPDLELPSADTGDEHCDEVTPTKLYISPDDSNSMSSPVQARMAILDGWSSLGSVPIRTYEFMNYYSFAYSPPTDHRLAVDVQMVRSPDSPTDEYVVQVGVTSPTLADEDRRPMNITLVLDRSGSMSGEPLQMLKETCRAIAASLRDGDVVSMVEWSDHNAIILDSHEVSGPDDSKLLRKISSLTAMGGTDLHAGLTKGYQLAEANRSADRIDRVVLISDGGANVGVTDIDLIAAKAGGVDEDGIYLVGVGVGSASTYHDDLMDAVTDAGKGASVFVGSEAEADKMFHTRFMSTMSVAARDVRIRLDLPPGFEIRKFSGEEYSTDPSEVDPQHLAPNDSMVFYQTIRTCAPELVQDDTALGVHLWWKDPITFEQHERVYETTFDALLGGEVGMLRKGTAVFEYAEGLKAWRTDSAEGSLDRAVRALELAEVAHPGDADLAEIRSVLDAVGRAR